MCTRALFRLVIAMRLVRGKLRRTFRAKIRSRAVVTIISSSIDLRGSPEYRTTTKYQAATLMTSECSMSYIL
jgi:hypothetical protein